MPHLPYAPTSTTASLVTGARVYPAAPPLRGAIPGVTGEIFSP